MMHVNITEIEQTKTTYLGTSIMYTATLVGSAPS